MGLGLGMEVNHKTIWKGRFFFFLISKDNLLKRAESKSLLESVSFSRIIVF